MRTILFIAAMAQAGACLAQAGNLPRSYTLSGRYEYRTDLHSQWLTGNRVCFVPGPRSAMLLPHSDYAPRQNGFCFENTAEAKRMLKIAEKEKKSGCGFMADALVDITDYKQQAPDSEGVDTATLEFVERVDRPQILACR